MAITFKLFKDATINEESLNALNFEFFSMKKVLFEREIAKLNKKIANEKGEYTEKAIEGFKNDKEVATLNLDKAEENIETLKKYATTGNTRTLLRLECCAWDSHLLTLAFEIDADILDEIEKCMNDYHILGKGNKKTCDSVLKNLIFNTLKVDDDNTIFAKHNFRCNSEMLRKIHETYTVGLEYNTKVVEDDEIDPIKANITLKESKLRGSIYTKKGNKMYDNFARTLSIVCTDAIIKVYSK